MRGKTSKRYVCPVVTGDKDSIQQALNKLYDDLNDLADATAQPRDETASRTKGQAGDMQLVEDKATGKAVLRGRTSKGWVDIAGADVAKAFDK